MPGQNRGISIFTKNSLHTQLITPAPECGARIECLGIQISLNESNLFLFNIYRPPHPTYELEMDELFGLAAHEPTIIIGDFNAHHPNWNDPTTSSAYKTNDAGLHIKLLLDSFPDVSLLNSKQATHTKGGVLDLTILSNSLVSTADWSFHPYLMSDHLATFTTLQLPRLPLPPPVPRWNLKKANWAHFTKLLEDWAEIYTPANNLHQLEQDFIDAIKAAADISRPKINHTYHAHKDSWFYNTRVWELKRRLRLFRNLLKKTNSPDIHESFKTLRRLVNHELLDIRNKAWLTWCENISAHTPLRELWGKLRAASGAKKNQSPPYTHSLSK